MSKQLLFIILIGFIFFSSCGFRHYGNDRLHEGDLLFQDLRCGELCDAITAVTKGVDGRSFSHCAMIVKDGDSLKVIEAIGKDVHFTSLRTFFARSGDTDRIEHITVERLKPRFQKLIPAAVEYVKSQLDVPYDDEFRIHNGKLYCSELLYEAFRSANHNTDFFNLEPMTFKSSDCHAFFPAWVKYYQRLNKPIPEGEPGLNPGSISRSLKLYVIHLNAIQ